MDKAIEAGLLKFSEYVEKAGLFVDNDGNYFLIGVGKVNCKKNSAIIDQVLDEIYKYTNEINITILIVPEEVYSNISTGTYKKITEMMNFRGA